MQTSNRILEDWYGRIKCGETKLPRFPVSSDGGLQVFCRLLPSPQPALFVHLLTFRQFLRWSCQLLRLPNVYELLAHMEG